MVEYFERLSLPPSVALPLRSPPCLALHAFSPFRFSFRASAYLALCLLCHSAHLPLFSSPAPFYPASSQFLGRSLCFPLLASQLRRLWQRARQMRRQPERGANRRRSDDGLVTFARARNSRMVGLITTFKTSCTPEPIFTRN